MRPPAFRLTIQTSRIHERFAAHLPALLFFAILAAGAVFRIALFRMGCLSFDSDQAISCISALRILREGTLRVYNPGQAYGGECFAFYLVPFHLFFTPSPALARMSMIPVALAISAAGYWSTRVAFHSRQWAFTVMMLLTFPPSMVLDFHLRGHFTALVTLSWITAFGILWNLSERTKAKAWTRYEFWMASAGGLVLGLSVWAYPLGILTTVSLLVGLALFPERLAGLLGFPSPTEDAPSRTNMALNLATLVVLGIFTWVLWYGRSSRLLPFRPSHRNWIPVACVCVIALLTAARAVQARKAGLAASGVLGILAMAGGLWVGSLPVIWYVWFSKQTPFGVDTLVNSANQAWVQFASIFHTGIPVLLGYFQNWRVAPPHTPTVLRIALLLVALILFSAGVIRMLLSFSRHRDQYQPLVIVLALAVLQVVAFSLSSMGNFVQEPRYLLLLYPVMVFTMAGGVHWLHYSRTQWGRVSALFLLLFLVVMNLGSCFQLPRRVVDPRTGMKPDDSRLLAFLARNNLDRVSCRFDASGYWTAYALSYVSDEKILFAPAIHPEGVWIRSERYQREVDGAKRLAYLIRRDSPLPGFLRHRNVEFKEECIGPYRVYFDLSPDILRSMTFQQYEEACRELATSNTRETTTAPGFSR